MPIKIYDSTYQVTETQIGAIGENAVAMHLLLDSKGRLSPFVPMADDMGLDLLVFDKETGRSIPLQVKSRTKALKKNPKTIHFEVRRATFKDNERAYLLAIFIKIDAGLTEIKRAWLIPMKELPQVASNRREKLVIRPSHDMKSKDRYSSYRCEGMAEVADRLMRAFEKNMK